MTAAVTAYQSMIENGVLAVGLSFAPAPDGAFAREWDVNGKKAYLSVKRA